jgi:hypothetical protein
MGFLLRPAAGFALAQAFQSGGAPLGELFEFASGLYFRGKLGYARRFGEALVIVPGRGLVSPDTVIRPGDLREIAQVPIDVSDPRYREPLERDAQALLRRLGESGEVVLLGSIATGKYADVLVDILGARLLFPPSFVGRGDMSRGGLLLRCARSGTELEYAPLLGAIRHGPRPPKLQRKKN